MRELVGGLFRKKTLRGIRTKGDALGSEGRMAKGEDGDEDGVGIRRGKWKKRRKARERWRGLSMRKEKSKVKK